MKALCATFSTRSLRRMGAWSFMGWDRDPGGASSQRSSGGRDVGGLGSQPTLTFPPVFSSYVRGGVQFCHVLRAVGLGLGGFQWRFCLRTAMSVAAGIGGSGNRGAGGRVRRLPTRSIRDCKSSRAW